MKDGNRSEQWTLANVMPFYWCYARSRFLVVVVAFIVVVIIVGCCCCLLFATRLFLRLYRASTSKGPGSTHLLTFECYPNNYRHPKWIICSIIRFLGVRDFPDGESGGQNSLIFSQNFSWSPNWHFYFISCESIMLYECLEFIFSNSFCYFACSQTLISNKFSRH